VTVEETQLPIPSGLVNEYQLESVRKAKCAGTVRVDKRVVCDLSTAHFAHRCKQL